MHCLFVNCRNLLIHVAKLPNMTDAQFMRRALDLAVLGAGNTRPNPMVGCVIVHEGKIIGEGYHKMYGEAHAEVNAIKSVVAVDLLSQSTAYVTLEPCSHYGKTPPCADLLIANQLDKVIICNTDPNPLVAGRGIKKLEDAGIKVTRGVLEQEGLELNKRFFTFHQKKRPFILLKWAQTTDGFIARENFDSKWISNQYSRQLVHKWRAEEAAIMVGTNTAKYDDPSLTVRDWKGANPMRVVIDRSLSLDAKLKLFDGTVDTLVLTTIAKPSMQHVSYIKLDELSPQKIIEALYKRNIQSVLIEGGSSLINSFIEENLWDEARVFTSKVNFGSGVAAPVIKVESQKEENIQGDQLHTFINY